MNQYRRLNRAVSTFLLISLLSTVSALGQDVVEKEIHPLQSDSDRLGMTAGAPYLSVNEFTAKVQLTLPPIGPPGIGVSPTYTAPNRDFVDDASYADLLGLESPFGLGWNLHFGYLTTQVADMVYPPDNQLDPDRRVLRPERVYYVEPSGDVTPFQRDAVFQSSVVHRQDIEVCPPPAGGGGPSKDDKGYVPTLPSNCVLRQDIRDSHFIDPGFRRITRVQADLFGEGRYYMLSPNGSRTTFEPAAFYLRPQTQPQIARYYPTRIEDATGRAVTIEYQQDWRVDETVRPLIQRACDSWGRCLEYEYQSYGASRVGKVVSRIYLTASGESDTDLMSFEYSTRSQGPGEPQYAVLDAMVTPLGHRFEFTVDWLPTGHFLPLLKEYQLPDMGTVLIRYAPFALKVREPQECPPCTIGANGNIPYHTLIKDQIRVDQLEYGGAIYGFSYLQSYEHLEVTIAKVGGTEQFVRTTRYHNDFDSGEAQPPEHDIGQPESRATRYWSGNEGVPTLLEEEWDYSSFIYGRKLVGQGHYSSDHVRQYSVKNDGAWIDTFFDYPVADRQRAIFVDSVRRMPRDNAGLTVRQDFSYEHRFQAGLSYDQTAFDHVYQMGLATEARETFLQAGKPDQTLGLVKKIYHHLWPLARVKLVYAKEPASPLTGDVGIRLERSFYPSGDYKGLLEWQEIDGYRTTYPAYQFGQPSRENPPGSGPDVVRNVLATGLVDWHEVDGVRVDLEHDLDLRLKQTVFVHDLPAINVFSPPQSWPTELRKEQGDRWSRSSLDPWGREVLAERLIDSGVTATSTTDYTPIGLNQQQTGPLGATTTTDLDVRGRPVKTVVRDATRQLAVTDSSYGFDPDTGRSTVTEIMRVNEEPGAQQVVKVTETDFAGRLVRAGTNGHFTDILIDYEPEDGGQVSELGGILSTVVPEGGQPRKTLTNWLGQTRWHHHPETGPVSYTYDERGLLVAQDGPGNERYQFEYDALGRPTSRLTFVQPRPGEDSAWVPLEEYTYHPNNNQLEQVVTHDGPREVRRRIETYDGQNRPIGESLFIPEPLPALSSPAPVGRLPLVEEFPLVWSASSDVLSYKVQFRKKDAQHLLRFTTLEPFYELTASRLLSAIDALPAAGQSEYDDLLGGGTLLNPGLEYEWRVRGLTFHDEPTPWTEWLKLSDRCQIVDFAVQHGLNSTPIIEWETYGCEEDFRYSVETLASTGDLADPECELSDGLFSGLKQGPRPAHFMFYGYDYSDVDAAHDRPIGYTIHVNGEHDCPPLAEARFRMEVIDHHDGDRVVDSRDPLTVTSTVDPEACHITSFYVNHGYDGNAPVITWDTDLCDDENVVIKASTPVEEVSPQCRLDGEVQWIAPQGSEAASFMIDGWPVPGGGEETCGPASAMDFRIEVHDGDDFDQEPLQSRIPKRALIDPEETGECYVRYFDVVHPGGTGLPEIRWQTRHCEDHIVNLRTSTLPGGFAADCRLREWLAEADLPLEGEIAAEFMARGYEVEGSTCEDIEAAEVWIEVIEPDGWLRDQSQIIPAYYTGGFVGGGGPCVIDSFTLDDSPGSLPSASWSLSCDDPGDLETRLAAEVFPDDYVVPGCERPAIWDGGGLVETDRPLSPMEAWWIPHCPPVPRVTLRLEVSSKSTGELLQSSTPRVASYKPCHAMPLRIDNQAGRLPVVEWQTTCPDWGYYRVRVKTESISPTPPGCEITNALWDGDKRGRRPVWYMEGYFGCPWLREADFWIEISHDPEGTEERIIFETTPKQRATYDGTPLAHDGCETGSFGVDNEGGRPVVSWQTECPEPQGYEVRVLVRSASPTPEGCAVDGVWDEGHLAGARELDFMTGYDDSANAGPGQTAGSCPAIREVHTWLEIREAGSGDLHRMSHVGLAIYEPKDLQIEPAQIDLGEVWPGGTLTASYRVRNAGDGAIDSPFREAFWLATAPEPGAGDLLLADSSVHTGGLAGGSEFVGTTGELELPGELAPGDYHLLIEADSTGDVAESSESNNVARVATLTVVESPACNSGPDFAGLGTVRSSASLCAAVLSWDSASSPCGNPVSYKVYRTSNPNVPPLPIYEIDSGVTSTVYLDQTVSDGAYLYYLVTAVDQVTGVESINTRVRGLQAECPGDGTLFEASAGRSPSQAVPPGTPVTLSWEFPGAVALWLVGEGPIPISGSLVVTPTETVIYDAHINFGSGVVSFRVTIWVDGSNPTPAKLDPCDQSCYEAVLIDGEMHYCRGVENDHHLQSLGTSVSKSPVWIATTDYDFLVGPGGNPRSPYCFQATCGADGTPPGRWKTPEDEPIAGNWLLEEAMEQRHEIVGDGWDNDCDGQIDETE